MSDNWRRSLEAKARQARANAQQAAEAQVRAEQAEQRAALLEVGLDPESPQARLAIRAHEGEWTADALRETLHEYELWPQQVRPDVARAYQTADTAAVGASSGGYINPLEELAQLPAYGMPGWETAKQRALEIARKAGVEIENSSPTGWVNGEGKRVQMTKETPVSRPTGE
jgi:hypothetical protein